MCVYFGSVPLPTVGNTIITPLEKGEAFMKEMGGNYWERRVSDFPVGP